MTGTCPAGHASDDSDYCSVCGTAMTGVAAPAPVRAAAAPTLPRRGLAPLPGPRDCPACGEPRAAADARFCEVCRYDFVSRAPGPPPTAAAPAKWLLVITVDASLDTEPDPATPPPVEPERIFPVEQSEMLVGRRDDRQQIRPALALHDPGASRRHARFLLEHDGTVSLHDLGSTNGTKLNGQDVVSGSVRRLKEDDEVTLGRWTRIRLKARP
jgi:hypothetical protein